MTSQPLRIVIIGGVAGGASAAARARRVNARAKITIIERGPSVSFANCGLPYHVGGEIASRDSLLVATPQLFRERFGIEVRTGTEAVEIDRATQQVMLRLADGTLDTIAYDRLILSPGSEPIRPPFMDSKLKNVSTMWTLADLDRVIGVVSAVPSPRCVVIGGGFVGIEVAEQLAHRGFSCTLIERSSRILRTLDAEMTRPLVSVLEAGGVQVKLNTSVLGITSEHELATAVETDQGTFEADLVISAIGVRPQVKLAREAGLELGPSGGVCVDGWMRTSDENIFAVGDCVEYPHLVIGKPALVPLAGPANRAGRIAGTVAAGGCCSAMRSVLGTSVVRIFRSTAASTGLSAAMCAQHGIEHRAVYIQAANHASYFPGAESLTLKLVYAPDGRILGAQGVGGEGVDKRIDVIATAMSLGGNVEDLAGLDLAYAPPYGSAKDPVHMAAFVACNDLAGTPSIIAPDADLSDFQVVDVRSERELEQLPLPGAIHIPVDTVLRDYSALDPSRPTVTVCHSGKRAHVAASILQSMGFAEVFNLTGGMAIRSQFDLAMTQAAQ